MGGHIFSLSLLFVYINLPVASSITVPKEWHAAIDDLCKQAEMGLFPHPSPHGQVLHGSFSPSLQSQVISTLSYYQMAIKLYKLISVFKVSYSNFTSMQPMSDTLTHMHMHNCGTGNSILDVTSDHLVST